MESCQLFLVISSRSELKRHSYSITRTCWFSIKVTSHIHEACVTHPSENSTLLEDMLLYKTIASFGEEQMWVRRTVSDIFHVSPRQPWQSRWTVAIRAPLLMWEVSYIKINLMYWILCNSYWDFADQKEITGYIHRVLPVMSSSKTAYFDCLFQTGIGQTRAVCFAPDSQPV